MTQDGDGPASITFDHETTPWYFGLTKARRRAIDARLRELAWDPERAPVRFVSPHGRTLYSALAIVDDRDVWAYRIDFAIDELMRQRAAIPAIAVLRARALARRR